MGAQQRGLDASRVAVVCGHPERVRLMGDRLSDARPHHGDFPFPATVGAVAGREVLAVASGMGGPATARVTRSLVREGYGTLLRVGGAGPVDGRAVIGDLVVATAAVRDEGTSDAFLPPGWPAVADPLLVARLRQAARELGASCRAGVVHTKDSFFGEIDPGSSPVQARLRARWEAWKALGVVASEMEAATMFAVAVRAGARAGALLRVNDVEHEAGDVALDERLCDVAVRALELMPVEVEA